MCDALRDTLKNNAIGLTRMHLDLVSFTLRHPLSLYQLALLIALSLGVQWPLLASAQDPASDEYLVKAAMLYKLAKFVVWPREDDGAGGPEFSICVVGRNPFGASLAALEGKTMGDATVRVLHFPKPEDTLHHCRVAFLAPEQKGQLEQLLRELHGRPILTVGDADHFAERGGMVELSPSGNRVGIVINQVMVRQAGLQVAAPLLSLSKVIDK